MADLIKYYAYSLGWSTVRRLPEKRAYQLFDSFADRVWRRRGAPVLQYEKNVARVVPDATPADLADLSRECMRSYARYWCDAFRMPDWSQQRIDDLPVAGVENIERARSAGRGPVLVAPHGGNYDHGAAFVASRFGGITTVAERLRPEKLFQRFLDFRTSRDVEVIPTGGTDIVSVLIDRIRSGRVVGLVGERDLSRHGIAVSFFGEEARMPAGAALVARRTGADLLPVSFFYRGRRAAARIFPPVPVDSAGPERPAVERATQGWADVIAEGIRAHPGDWHMLQPLWTADLDPDRDPLRRAGRR